MPFIDLIARQTGKAADGNPYDYERDPDPSFAAQFLRNKQLKKQLQDEQYADALNQAKLDDLQSRTADRQHDNQAQDNRILGGLGGGNTRQQKAPAAQQFNPQLSATLDTFTHPQPNGPTDAELNGASGVPQYNEGTQVKRRQQGTYDVTLDPESEAPQYLGEPNPGAFEKRSPGIYTSGQPGEADNQEASFAPPFVPKSQSPIDPIMDRLNSLPEDQRVALVNNYQNSQVGITDQMIGMDDKSVDDRRQAERNAVLEAQAKQREADAQERLKQAQIRIDAAENKAKKAQENWDLSRQDRLTEHDLQHQKWKTDGAREDARLLDYEKSIANTDAGRQFSQKHQTLTAKKAQADELAKPWLYHDPTTGAPHWSDKPLSEGSTGNSEQAQAQYFNVMSDINRLTQELGSSVPPPSSTPPPVVLPSNAPPFMRPAAPIQQDNAPVGNAILNGAVSNNTLNAGMKLSPEMKQRADLAVKAAIKAGVTAKDKLRQIAEDAVR